jgi:Tfp pilus assembly protein PilX
MGQHDQPDDRSNAGQPARVSRALGERLRRQKLADFAFRQEEHAVNIARVAAYRTEYLAARHCGDEERMAAILAKIRKLCTASRQLIAQNKNAAAWLRWQVSPTHPPLS